MKTFQWVNNNIIITRTTVLYATNWFLCNIMKTHVRKSTCVRKLRFFLYTSNKYAKNECYSCCIVTNILAKYVPIRKLYNYILRKVILVSTLDLYMFLFSQLLHQKQNGAHGHLNRSAACFEFMFSFWKIIFFLNAKNPKKSIILCLIISYSWSDCPR